MVFQLFVSVDEPTIEGLKVLDPLHILFGCTGSDCFLSREKPTQISANEDAVPLKCKKAEGCNRSASAKAVFRDEVGFIPSAKIILLLQLHCENIQPLKFFPEKSCWLATLASGEQKVVRVRGLNLKDQAAVDAFIAEPGADYAVVKYYFNEARAKQVTEKN